MEKEFENDINYLDQHFLIDKSIINAFIDAAKLSINENVVEIGPGKTLSGLVRKTLTDVKCYAVTDVDSLNQGQKEVLC